MSKITTGVLMKVPVSDNQKFNISVISILDKNIDCAGDKLCNKNCELVPS